MKPRNLQLAIETTCRGGSLTVGQDGTPIATVDLPKERRQQEGLLAAVDSLFQAHGMSRSNLGQIFVSVGPGSFTGLRVAIATVKVIATVLDIQVVAVPTIDVVARGIALDDMPAANSELAVRLNLKQNSAYTARYAWAGGWQPLCEPAVLSFAELCDVASRPLAVACEVPFEGYVPDGVFMLPPAMAEPRSEQVYAIGCQMADRGMFISADALLPLYVRQPEAVTLWEQRQEVRP